uniref:Melatonin receptor type 1A n=1 Tax=Rusa timorensis TaxID=1088130 RepID=A0A5P9VLF8_9CERV|nr:melatonin receptor 1a [Rusa timorensis]
MVGGSTHWMDLGLASTPGLNDIGSVFNITGIAINRYCYICHSLRYDRLYSSKNSLCCVFLIWMLTLVAIVPNLCVGTLQYDPRVYSCTFTQSVSSAYTIAVVVFHFIVPMLVVIFCYLRIWALVLQVRWRVKPDNKPKLKPQDFRNFVTMFVVFCPLRHLLGSSEFHRSPSGLQPRQHGTQDPRVAVCGQVTIWRISTAASMRSYMDY